MALVATIAAAIVVAAAYQSPENRRTREVAAAVGRLLHCGHPVAETVEAPAGTTRVPRAASIRRVACEGSDALAPGVVLERFRTQADADRASAADRASRSRRAECRTARERFILELVSADAVSPSAVADERRRGRLFCQMVGATPTFRPLPNPAASARVAAVG